MTKFIYLTQQKPPNKEDAKLLHSLLSQGKGPVWTTGSPIDGNTAIGSTILSRKSKRGDQIRYEVISQKPIGEGGFGAVYAVEMTIILDKSTIKFKPRSQRVVKVSKLLLGTDAASIIKEYELTQQAGHLHIKEPVLVMPQEEKGKGKEPEEAKDKIPQSYMVMKRVPGISLTSIIKDLNEKKLSLTLQQRLDLTLTLLVVYQTQVQARGLLHKDIKPDNFLVELGPPLRVNVIDFGLSSRLDTLDHSREGTQAYMAPELLLATLHLPGHVHANSDIFSLGLILEELWAGTLPEWKDEELNLGGLKGLRALDPTMENYEIEVSVESSSEIKEEGIQLDPRLTLDPGKFATNRLYIVLDRKDLNFLTYRLKTPQGFIEEAKIELVQLKTLQHLLMGELTAEALEQALKTEEVQKEILSLATKKGHAQRVLNLLFHRENLGLNKQQSHELEEIIIGMQGRNPEKRLELSQAITRLEVLRGALVLADSPDLSSPGKALPVETFIPSGHKGGEEAIFEESTDTFASMGNQPLHDRFLSMRHSLQDLRANEAGASSSRSDIVQIARACCKEIEYRIENYRKNTLLPTGLGSNLRKISLLVQRNLDILSEKEDQDELSKDELELIIKNLERMREIAQGSGKGFGFQERKEFYQSLVKTLDSHLEECDRSLGVVSYRFDSRGA